MRWTKGIDSKKKLFVTRRYFECLSYDEKLDYCDRPEQVEGPCEDAWQSINDHLVTNAKNIQQLIDQLGKQRFGHTPRVGDAFCGGGSIPFEAARIGCDAYASDLNPVAALLTWASINLIGGGEEVQDKVKKAQQSTFKAVDKQITEWGIEHNDKGWRADAYLYCVEAICPATGYLLPLAPSWIISEKYKVCAVLKADPEYKRYNIEVVVDADKETFAKAKLGTVQNGRMVCPETGETYAVSTIRGDKTIEGKAIYGLRLWENDDLEPRKNDVFQERLYGVRWVETYWDTNAKGEMVEKKRRHYCAVSSDDLLRENKVLELLQEYFTEWQKKGFIPSNKIDDGAETTRLKRERGWNYWHNLFLPRQLIWQGLLRQEMYSKAGVNKEVRVAALLMSGILANFNSKLCIWDKSLSKSGGIGAFVQTFSNQTFNTLYNCGVRCGDTIAKTWDHDLANSINCGHGQFVIKNIDAREVCDKNDIFITDPPYADAINYHELLDYYLAWYGDISHVFSEWDGASKKSLAVKGTGEDFQRSMVEIYSNLTSLLPDNGLQMVQFTHQDPAVWADLGMVLWVAGLQVCSAWTVSTETDDSRRTGNFVQGTVLLVLRKRNVNDVVFPDQLPDMIEDEVQNQLDEMLALDDKDEPNFGDTDYQLAAYAAALRVMTQFSAIEGINIENELYREKQKGHKSEFEKLIDQAVETACNYLIPSGFDEFQWKSLSAPERFYLKGLELEKHGELRAGAYQELANGFGLREYTFMYAKTKANEVRFKTATEFKRANLRGDGFADSVMRHILFALHETVKREAAKEGLNYLRSEINDYWGQRKKIAEILRYLNRLHHVDHMPHWEVDAKAADTLAGAVDNDFA